MGLGRCRARRLVRVGHGWGKGRGRSGGKEVS